MTGELTTRSTQDIGSWYKGGTSIEMPHVLPNIEQPGRQEPEHKEGRRPREGQSVRGKRVAQQVPVAETHPPRGIVVSTCRTEKGARRSRARKSGSNSAGPSRRGT